MKDQSPKQQDTQNNPTSHTRSNPIEHAKPEITTIEELSKTEKQALEGNNKTTNSTTNKTSKYDNYTYLKSINSGMKQGVNQKISPWYV